MNRLEEPGDLSMEEILASIRRIISEDSPEPAGPVPPASREMRDDTAEPQLTDANGHDLDFDLPSMFKPSVVPVQERSAPLLGRLTEALLGNRSTATQPEATAPQPPRSLDQDLADLLETPVKGRAPPPAYGDDAGSGPRTPIGRSAWPSMDTPQDRRLLDTLDQRLAQLGGPDDEPELPGLPEARPILTGRGADIRIDFGSLMAGDSTGIGAAQPVLPLPGPAAAQDFVNSGPVVLAAMPTGPSVARTSMNGGGQHGVDGAGPPSGMAWPPDVAQLDDSRPMSPATTRSPALTTAPAMLTNWGRPADPIPVEHANGAPRLPAAPQALDMQSIVASAMTAVTAGLTEARQKAALPSAALGAEHNRGESAGAPALNGAAPMMKPGPAGAGLLPIDGQVRALDDAVSELLRPLLRQWLDDNMPRIVEAALKVELADSVKAPPEGSSKV